MNSFSMRRMVIGDQAVEVWESPDVAFEATIPALARYAASEDWVGVFNVLTLRSAPLRAE
jgi:hypothetical protein